MTSQHAPKNSGNSTPAYATDAHQLDQACSLQIRPDGLLDGATHPAYANMVGPFGGVIAATLLNAPLSSPERLGDPVALTVNFAAPITDGPFQIRRQATRTNRSTQHWSIELLQQDQVCATASAVFAIRRETWSSTEITAPMMPDPNCVPVWKMLKPLAWPRSYRMQFTQGALDELTAEGMDGDSASSLWIRDEPARPLDFLSLTAISDAFFPRIFLRRGRWTPIGTVSMTTYFHACADTLAAQGSESVFGSARAQHFGKGFSDQTAELWGRDGTLLANSHQIVYFKE
jgi:acyl-coenzyme A thioesterase PaaI-like protein